MRTGNKVALAVSFACVATAIVAIPPKILSFSKLIAGGQKQADDRQLPIADYSAPESSDAVERAKRQEKGRRYRGKRIREEPQISVVSDSESLVERLKPLPIALSDSVIIGEIRNAQAYLSDDKSGIYSEFTIRVEDVLKSSDPSLGVGATIIAEREGGAVRFPSGHLQRYVVEGERMPKMWSRYLFFLKRNESGQDFSLLKGYELRVGKVFPLDDFSRDAAYKGTNQDEFLNTVRRAIADSSRACFDKSR